ncbi:GMC family oxidoreductase [Aspergillus lucknowensis]|uniref:Alcohol oxidase n=1 Tax=Aspergillus lucknowensis TaxID=176173 RepID=A0ABR4LIR6_9EURO
MIARPIICSLAEFLAHEYDYIIVGGGTAGLVLASRLSEDPDVRVGVLEAGEARLEDPNIASPVGMSAMMNNPDYDWCFKSTPQKGNNNKTLHVARGKTLGGSSAINFLAYFRPSKDDLDAWESLGPGTEGWNWAALEPYYRKSQRIAQGYVPMQEPLDSFALDSRFHGDGPIGTSFPVWRYPVEDALLRAFDAEGGLSRSRDAWSGEHLGFFGTLATVDRSGTPRRSDAATGYLKGIGERGNLRILTNALVHRVILDETGPVTARGVVFSYEGHEHQVLARRETIISSSTIKSPQLLELSGIGDPAVLDAASITTRVPLPAVGNNLQEHPLTTVTYELKDGESLDTLLANPQRLGEAVAQYLEDGTGPASGCMSLAGFLPYASLVSKDTFTTTLDRIQPSTLRDIAMASLLHDPNSPSVQFTCLPTNFSPQNGHYDLTRVMTGAPAGYGACYTVLVNTSYPLSRGSSHITSSDPQAHPKVDLGVFSAPVDIDVMVAGVKFMDKCFRSPHVADQMGRRVNPPASVDIEDAEQVKAYVQDNILIFNHILGTCAMGEVVDERLRVKGVRGLRVVDASVLPMQMSGNILATVYAVAERAADLIKQDAKAV